MKSIFEYEKPSKANIVLLILLSIALIVAVLLTQINHSLYSETIAGITGIVETYDGAAFGVSETEEQYYQQKIEATIMNGEDKGKAITLVNERTSSGVYDETLKAGDDIFVSFDEYSGIWTYDEIKRDTLLASAGAIFILVAAAIGRRKGILSLASVLINIAVFSYAISKYMQGTDIMLLATLSAVFFSVVSLIMYCGFTRKTLSAVLATLAGLASSMLIAVAVITITDYHGVWVESLEFLIIETDYRSIFLAGLLIGGLGAIMDIAVTVTSSLFELNASNPHVTTIELIKSGRAIGKDIMGTMVNVMFFTFIGGSLPIILLSGRNGISIADYFTSFASIELVRFLTGSIGLVLAIPISLFISIFMLRRRYI